MASYFFVIPEHTLQKTSLYRATGTSLLPKGFHETSWNMIYWSLVVVFFVVVVSSFLTKGTEDNK